MKIIPIPAGTRVAAATLVVCCLFLPAAARAEQPQPAGRAAKTVDALLVRPVALPFAIAGTAIYLGTLPLTFLINTDGPSADLLVRGPWRFTAGRPLGRFDSDAP